MDRRKQTDRVGEQLNNWIRGEMQTIAEGMGLDELPLSDPDFDFYQAALHRMYGLGFRGQDLYDETHRVVQSLFYNLRTGGRGVIYSYPKYYQTHRSIPFDTYFKFAVSQKGKNALNTAMRHRSRFPVSIYPGGRGEDDRGGISEESIGETDISPVDDMESREMIQRRDQAMDEVPDMLAEQRNGDRLLYVWYLMQEGKTLREIAEELNAQGVPTASGGEWGTGSVDKTKSTILILIRQFLEKRGVDAVSVASSRQPMSNRVAFRSRGRA